MAIIVKCSLSFKFDVRKDTEPQATEKGLNERNLKKTASTGRVTPLMKY